MNISVECPVCRKEVEKVTKNPTINSLIETYLAVIFGVLIIRIIQRNVDLKKNTKKWIKTIKYHQIW